MDYFNQGQMSLSELTERIEQVISTGFADTELSVVAEITNLKKQPTGYYMDLIEKSENVILSKVRATIWRQTFSRVENFEMTTGMTFESNIKVLLRVKVNFHSVYGLSLTVVDIDCNYTLGNYELNRRNTFAQLVGENPTHIKLADGHYVTRNKNLVLPPLLQRIALVASTNSDGYRDFIHELNHNAFGYSFSIFAYHSLTQGEQAVKSIAGVMKEIFDNRANYDVVVIIRGGGAQTDFSAYDSYELSRLIALFPIPVLTGIGHICNESISDLMAHASFKTPTKVASYIVEGNYTSESRFLNKANRLVESVLKLNRANENQLRHLVTRLTQHTSKLLQSETSDLLKRKNSIIRACSQVVFKKTMELELIISKTRTNVLQYFTTQANRVDQQEFKLLSMDSHRLFQQGYSLVSFKGKIVKNPDELKEGDMLDIYMSTTIFSTEIKSIQHGGKQDL